MEMPSFIEVTSISYVLLSLILSMLAVVQAQI